MCTTRRQRKGVNIAWACIGLVLCLYWACIVLVLGLYWAFIGLVLAAVVLHVQINYDDDGTILLCTT